MEDRWGRAWEFRVVNIIDSVMSYAADKSDKASGLRTTRMFGGSNVQGRKEAYKGKTTFTTAIPDCVVALRALMWEVVEEWHPFARKLRGYSVLLQKAYGKRVGGEFDEKTLTHSEIPAVLKLHVGDAGTFEMADTISHTAGDTQVKHGDMLSVSSRIRRKVRQQGDFRADFILWYAPMDPESPLFPENEPPKSNKRSV